MMTIVGRIAGTLLILFGVLFLMKPHMMQRRIQRTARRKIRRIIFLAASSVGVMLISAGWSLEGWLPKVLVFVGIVAILKAVFFLRSKSAEKVTEWMAGLPIMYFRLAAVIQIALGLLTLYGMKE